MKFSEYHSSAAVTSLNLQQPTAVVACCRLFLFRPSTPFILVLRADKTIIHPFIHFSQTEEGWSKYCCWLKYWHCMMQWMMKSLWMCLALVDESGLHSILLQFCSQFIQLCSLSANICKLLHSTLLCWLLYNPAWEINDFSVTHFTIVWSDNGWEVRCC